MTVLAINSISVSSFTSLKLLAYLVVCQCVGDWFVALCYTLFSMIRIEKDLNVGFKVSFLFVFCLFSHVTNILQCIIQSVTGPF